MDPLKIVIMDVDTFVRENDLKEVTSTFIKESGSTEFDSNGLFSENIFGEMASKERISTFGYVDLHSKIIHPKLFSLVLEFRSYYLDIIRGLEYAVFDEKEKDFVLVSESAEGASTGYSFFIENISKVVPKENDSIRRTTKIEVFLKNKDKLFIDKLLVIPAGIRDYKEMNGRGEYDDINKYYMTAIGLSKSLLNKTGNSSLFDPILLAIQKKVNDIYEHIWNLADGKKGYIQHKYASRAVALGTRNVISAIDTSAKRADDPSYLKSDEVLVPLYQVLNMFKPLMLHALKGIFFNSVFNKDTVQASLIDPKEMTLSYQTISIKEKQKFLTSDKISDTIASFRDDEVKHLPVVVYNEENKPFYLYLTYRHKNKIYLSRSIKDLETMLVNKNIVQSIDRSMVRPLTYFEMFYIAAYSMMPKYTTITRYPVTGTGSIYPAKVHIATTTSFETLELSSFQEDGLTLLLPRYPILNASVQGGLSVHPSRLAILGGD